MNTIKTRNLLMLAAENGALNGGKVGGIGDVLRDLPVALADRDWSVTVMTPSYGMFYQQEGALHITQVEVAFSGRSTEVDVYRIPGRHAGISHLVLEHTIFSPKGAGHIYCHDEASAPFATDATKFAFFSAAAAACIKANVVTPDVIHVHDWHGAFLLALREYDPDYASLKKIRTVYTIHNLALQGIRPLTGHPSALESWFPDLNYHHGEVVDPRYHDCVNPMALAIRLADYVNTVSPTYALEILDANDPAKGLHGGEGLELDLQVAAREERLVGILNGCSYDQPRIRRPAWKTLRVSIVAALEHWMSRSTYLHSSHYLAHKKITTRLTRKPTTLLVSIGRATSQKVSLFLQATSSGQTALEKILDKLSPGELFVMLGSGDAELSSRLTEIAHRYDSFLFLEGFIDGLPDLLYGAGDVFLMPSSFEPCGISQMLALRAGQPCVVHGVGGLRDTIDHGRTGYVFEGTTPVEQADRFVSTVGEVLALRASDKTTWQALCDAARAERFNWDKAAQHYEQVLYANHDA